VYVCLCESECACLCVCVREKMTEAPDAISTAVSASVECPVCV